MRTVNSVLIAGATTIGLLLGCGTLPPLVNGIIDNPFEPPDDGVRPPVSPTPAPLLDSGEMWTAMCAVLGREPQPDELYLTHFDEMNHVVWVAVYEWDGQCKGALKSVVGDEEPIITLLASAVCRRANKYQ